MASETPTALIGNTFFGLNYLNYPNFVSVAGVVSSENESPVKIRLLFLLVARTPSHGKCANVGKKQSRLEVLLEDRTEMQLA